MRISRLIKRSLTYYWRNNIAVVLGVATAIGVLAGALLVGNSVRASLKNLVLQRLGQTSFVITSDNFIREELAQEIQGDPEFALNGFAAACPLISVEARVTHEPGKTRASSITAYGVDDRFWTFNRRKGNAPQNRSVFVSQSLARELGAKVGDSIVLQLKKPSDIPLESLHSKKEDLGKKLRLTVDDILDADALGEFSIQPQQTSVRAIFISLQLLQRELEQPDKINLVLVSEANGIATLRGSSLSEIVRRRATLSDSGIHLRPVTTNDQHLISVEHDSRMLDDSLAKIVEATADSLQLHYSGVLSYLANSIASGERSIPYSLVTGLSEAEFQSLLTRDGKSVSHALKSDRPPIILNEWAAKDLGVRVGDPVTIEYYLWQEVGRLDTKSAIFELAGIVPIDGLAADRNLVPEYPGISGSENLSDWDPPFPIDLQRIRQKDEDYWRRYHATPKAFVPLTAAQSLWQSRFGKVTSLRIWANDASRSAFAVKLQSSINPMLRGAAVVPVRSQGLDASRGATDFGEYFLYFSFFLVISALLLTTLFFKLGIEQRLREIGTLRAIGFGPSTIRKLFLLEGLILALIGSVLGLIGAVAYGQLMMFGLRTWWVGAVATTSLRLHVSPQSLLLGSIGGIVAALVCVALTLRNLKTQSTRGLLAGSISTISPQLTTGQTSFRIALGLTLFGSLLLIASAVHFVGQVAGFFGSGVLLLAAFLCYESSWLRRRPTTVLAGAGWWSIARVGLRNATYRPARSILCIALISSATFVIVSVDSFRHRESDDLAEKKSGTGGFPLFAESLVPLVHDPSSSHLFDENSDSLLRSVTLTRFRVQPGDDASCLNLYQPRNPKIIAPTDDFLESNRFTFQSTLSGVGDNATNPWLLLNHDFPDGAIPVIADANSLTYVLHLKLGDDLRLEHGEQPVRARVVGALSDSLFQSEVIMSEKNFVRLFPDQHGYRLFLIDTSNADPARVAAALEDRLADYGFDVQPTAERLASFHRVENTYLSTFQMLGGLGVILGTIGLAAVLLRNVLERRRELALMRAVGFNARHFMLMIIAENALLLFAGVVTGTLCAAVAVTPVFLTRHNKFSTISLGLLLLTVLASGLTASIVATWATIRAPLLTALKAE